MTGGSATPTHTHLPRDSGHLEAHPDAVVRRTDQRPRPVQARLSAGQERVRLWQRWVAVNPQFDAYAGLRSTETPLVVLEPRGESA